MFLLFMVPWSIASVPFLLGLWMYFRRSSMHGLVRALAALVASSAILTPVAIGTHGFFFLPRPVALVVKFLIHPGSKIFFVWWAALLGLAAVLIAVVALPGFGRALRPNSSLESRRSTSAAQLRR